MKLHNLDYQDIFMSIFEQIGWKGFQYLSVHTNVRQNKDKIELQTLEEGMEKVQQLIGLTYNVNVNLSVSNITQQD